MRNSRLKSSGFLGFSREADGAGGASGGGVGRALYPYFWIAPALLLLFFLYAYPWSWTAYISSLDFDGDRPGSRPFVLFANYLFFFIKNPEFAQAMLRTLIMMVSSTVWVVLLGLVLASALTSPRIRMKTFFRVGFLLPGMLTPVAIGMMWRIILWSNWGLAQYFLTRIGLPKIDFLGSPSWTIFVVIIMEVWVAYPITMLILLAGLVTVPNESVEAAVIDGASRFQIFRFIKVPWIRPQLMLVILFRVIFSLRSFGSVWALYQGSGPLGSGRIMGVYFYEHFSLTRHFGQSSALAYILLIMTFILGIGLFQLMASREEGAI